jgi:sterol desaturase/sphingolipid hydroxylase (fatty acid hydroxylase superfamily)
MEARSAARQRILEAYLHAYRGAPGPIRLVVTLVLCTGACAFALSMLRTVTWVEACIFVAALVFANVAEWFLHAKVMHRPVRLLRSVYRLHAKRHHAIYVTEDMGARESREWPFILMEPMEFLGLAVIAACVGGVVGAVFGQDAGWTVVAALAMYVGAYEILHLSYHLPADHPIGRNRLIRRLARHHAIHHDLGLMGKWNMNITVPLADICLRTVAPRALIAQRAAARAARR